MKITVFIDLVEIDADWAERIHDTAGVKTNNYTKYLHFLAARYPDDLSSRNIDRQTSHYKEFLDDPNYTAAVPQLRAALMKVLLPYFKNSPRSVQDEKMIAFLFGLIAHQEGDAPWHWGYCDTDWKGLECALPYKVWPIKWNEIDLDNVLAHYDINGPDGENTVDFDFYPSTKPIILAAADAIGQLPECHMLGCSDPLGVGNVALQALWGLANNPHNIAFDEMKSFLKTYVPGGIDYGAALTAASWMQTWDLMDNYAPVTTIDISPAAPDGNNGWYRQQVTINLNVKDNFLATSDTGTLYSIDGGQSQAYVEPFTISTDGIHQIDYYSVDSNGISEPVQYVTIKIDTTSPSISGAATTLPNNNGWYNNDVTVHFNAEDWVSELDTLTSDQTLTGEGVGQSVIGTAVDLAGNSASATVEPINIDKTPPTITYGSRTAANMAGWNNTPVTVHWTCADIMSGPASAAVSQTLTVEGSGQSATGTCSDNAGNTAQDTQTGINIDITKPTLNPTASPNPVVLHGSVVLDAGAEDAVSGIATQQCAPVDTNSAGTKIVTCTATDNAGNSASALLIVVVQTPKEAIQDIIANVQELVDAGDLNQGQGNALIAKLEAAVKSIDKGNITPALNQLQAFINQINAFINSGQLTPSVGQALIDAANAVINSLGG
jgi:hypothetical protein